jgi:hypothetical protein
MAGRRFPRPWRFEPIPGGYRVVDANGLAMAHVYGELPNALATSPHRLTDDEARRISKLIARLPELVELEQDRSRRKPQPFRFKPVTIGDLIREGKLLEDAPLHHHLWRKSSQGTSMPCRILNILTLQVRTICAIQLPDSRI